MSEIPLVTVMKSPYGRKALLHLLQPFKHDPSLTKEEEAEGHIIPNNMISQLEPDEWEYFQVRSLPATSSKKSPEQRVKEHLVYLQHSALTTGFDDKELVRACMLDGNASRVLMGLIETFQPPSLCQNILDLALENATEDEDDEELNATGGERFLEDFSAHKVVQRCLQVQRRAVEAEVEASGETDADAASASVSTTYWPEERVDFCGEMSKYLCAAKNEPMLHDWLKTNRLSYIVVELLKTAGVSAGGDIQSTELGKAVTRALSPVIAATATSAATPKKKGTPKKATAALAAAVKCENKILTDLMFGAKA